ncbi:MAG: acyltransferase family protein [Verrucomicrobiales bacterium]
MNPIAAAVAAAREEQAKQIAAQPPRLTSIDAFRGFAMFLMAAEWLHLPKVASSFQNSRAWQIIGRHTQHVEWTGCALHDLIQPSFSFMVGAAIPFSMASRTARGQSRVGMWLHALLRAVILVLLGVFLRSIGQSMTYWTFEDTLSQIGLGYPILFALAFLSRRWQWAALAMILLGYWAAFALHPRPPSDFDWAKYNAHAYFEGFAAHWNKNSNAAWAFDRWFLNLFPRQHEFLGNPGGYSTLSFIPTLGTMILGLIAGGWLKEWARPPAPVDAEIPRSTGKPLGKLVLAGVICLALGWAFDRFGICPSVKKIWTPSWTLFSGGWCFLLMAAFHAVADLAGWRSIFFPLVVIGMNSIAAYVLAHQPAEFISRSLDTHFGKEPFFGAGQAYQLLLHGTVVLILIWLILFWMRRRRLYLRI